jgi:hypothetical protein
LAWGFTDAWYSHGFFYLGHEMEPFLVKLCLLSTPPVETNNQWSLSEIKLIKG